ncbi:DIS3-like exonuclease 2 [Mactra antiquata]
MEEEGESIHRAEASVLDDLLVSGLVKPAEYKPKSGTKSKAPINEDNSNAADKSTYTAASPKKAETTKTASGNSGGDLFAYVDSELACLQIKDQPSSGKSKSEKKGVKSGSNIASVSAEHQKLFESLLNTNDSEIASGGMDVASVGLEEDKSKTNLDGTDVDLCMNLSGNEQRKPQKSVRDKEHKPAQESPKKKKDKQQKGLGKKKDGQASDGGTLGSYSKLLVSMGSRSPHRKIEILDEQDGFMPLIVDEENPSPGKKKRNRRKKGDKSKDMMSPPSYNESEAIFESPKERPQSGNKKKKDKTSPVVVREKDVKTSVDRNLDTMATNRLSEPQQDQLSKKQKKKLLQQNMSKSPEPQSKKKTESRPSSAKARQARQNQTMAERQYSTEDAFIEVSVNLPKSDHMYVIGPQGKHLQEIMSLTGVVVSVPKLNSKSDEIVLRGDKMQIGSAMSLMFSLCEQAKMESRQSRQGQGHEQRNLDQSSHSYQRMMQVQGHDGYDLAYQGQPLSYLNDGPNGGRKRIQMHAGQIANQSGQQGQRHSRGHQNEDQGRRGPPVQGQGHRGHGHNQQGQHEPQLQSSREMEQGPAKGQGKRQRKNKKCVFADYISNEELTEGLKNGTIIEGPIRINPRSYEEAYVNHPDGKSDVLISSLKSRNRALNGDIVAVRILHEGEWKIHNNDLAEIGNTADDSDPEVVIESEEIVEVVTNNKNKSKNSTPDQSSTSGSNLGQAQAKNLKDNKEVCHSPKKRFTTFNEMMSGQSPVKKSLLTESGRDKIKKLFQRTGVVVSIIEKRSSMTCAGHIKLMQDKNPNIAMFSPNDHRMPRIIVPMSECPKDFYHRPEDYVNTLYVCRITEWRQDNFYSQGCLVKCLGESGEIEPETEGMLYENDVDFSEFPDKAIDCLPSTPWSIPATEFDYRRDFRTSCIFTIDPSTARDLDDALSCEDMGDGRYKIGVHIADVSYFVKENTDLDIVASSRSTSVYLVHKVIPMLPRLLCEQLCSLNPDEDRLTFSVEWIINEQGEIEDEWFGRSVIRSCVKLAYDHAQGFIEEPDRDWTTEELPPISETFTVNDIKTRVLNLHKIALKLRKARMDGGALRLDQIKLQYSLDSESGLPNGYMVYQQKDSNRLVEEFMLLANMAVAHKINHHFPEQSILRRHPPPQEKMVETLKEQCSTLGIHLDTSSAGALQASLRNYSGDDDVSLARMQVLVALCSKPMQNAVYFCTGCLDDENLYRHYALNVPLYTHFTSPIRRYPDILVHRLLGAALDYSDKPSRQPGDLEKIAKHCNDKKTNAKRVGDLSSDLFFSVFVQTAGPLEERAMVMGVLDKAFDIFVLKLGVSKRVYCDKLPIKEKIFKHERKVPSLTLVWDSVDGEPEFRQEITIFSMVDCVLEKGDMPLQWTAVIKRPTPVVL